MQTQKIQLADVIYNATEQCFEALVTVYDADTARKYACAINAPITMSYADAAGGLSKQALRRHASHNGMYSEIRHPAPVQRAGRPGFDPRRWLENLMQSPGRHAA